MYTENKHIEILPQAIIWENSGLNSASKPFAGLSGHLSMTLERIYSYLQTRSKREKALEIKNRQLEQQNRLLAIQNREMADKKRELELSIKAKSELIARTSHQLRTPLNSIIGFSELMQDGITGAINDEQKDSLNEIMKGAQSMLRLVNDALDLSKMEAGKMALKPESLKIDAVISEVVRRVKPLADKKGHRLTVSIDDRIPPVRADEDRLSEVLLNLLSNAIKFTPTQGKITVEAFRDDDLCLVSVIDNGPGIREEEQDLIFEPFYHAEIDGDTKSEGTGLGLSIARRYVELSGGRIWVESEAGRGSKFCFSLPLAYECEDKRLMEAAISMARQSLKFR